MIITYLQVMGRPSLG